MSNRIAGFDIARALAIFGMVTVNFKIATEADIGNAFLLWFASCFEGRASALFVVLAGVGITFLVNKVNRMDIASVDNGNKSSTLSLIRLSLVKRGAFLIIIGLAFTSIWPADILHFYGFYFFCAAFLFTLKDRQLISAAFATALIFPLLLGFFNYDSGWNWETLEYIGFWTFDGMFRHILFNGFHPIFPWISFLFLGMWLARKNLTCSVTRKRLMIRSFIIYISTEALFLLIKFILPTLSISHVELGLTTEEADVLFSTAMMPPLPQYIIAASSLAVFIILSCISISERFKHSALCKSLAKTGRLSLTLYLAHILIGMGTLELFGLLDKQPIEFALFCSLLFCLFSVLFSHIWLKRFTVGPFEYLFRNVVSK